MKNKKQYVVLVNFILLLCSCGPSFTGDCKIDQPILGKYDLINSTYNDYGKIEHSIILLDSNTAVSIYNFSNENQYIDTMKYKFNYNPEENINNRYIIIFRSFYVYKGAPLPHPIGVADKDTIYQNLPCAYFMTEDCNAFKFTTSWLSGNFDYVLADPL